MDKRPFLLLVIGIAAIGHGQTSDDLSARYHPTTVYQLRPDVTMTPQYADDGQVCEMALERRQNTDAGIVFAAPFSEHEVSEFINELAPEAKRGRNLTRALNENVDGDFITTTYTYENVLVRVYGIIRSAPGGDSVITITWRKRKCSEKTANMRLTTPIGTPSKPKP